VAFKKNVAVSRYEVVKHYYETFVEDEEDELDLERDRFPADRFKPVAELGRGASGTVWLARDRLLKKRVAVKVLHATDEKSLIMLQEEARTISVLKHPNIVEILNFGLVNTATPYMVLDYVPGVSLRAILERDKRLDTGMALSIIIQVCEALSSAHRAGIFHRDIQPGNLLVVEEPDKPPTVKVIDFGIARVFDRTTVSSNAQGQTLAGSPLYMSPDVGLGRGYEASSEIYSVGCVLFEMLTGRPPYLADNPLLVLSMHANAEIPSVVDDTDISTQLNLVIRKALSKEQRDRFQSADEMLDALKEIAVEGGLPENAHPKVDLAYEGKSGGKVPRTIALLALLLISLLSANALLNLSVKDSSRKRENAKAKEKGHKPAVTSTAPLMPIEFESSLDEKWRFEGGTLIAISVEDEDFKELAYTGKLERIDRLEILSTSSAVTGTGLKYLLGHKFLRIDTDSSAFGDDGARILSSFREITFLGISGSKRLTEKGLAEIVKMPNLYTIQLRFMNLPTNACKLIASSQSIQSVNLGHTGNLTPDDLRNLACNSRIKVLRVAATNSGDRVVDTIAKLKLTDLDINENPITDVGLMKLGKMVSLRRLRLTVGEGITENGIRRLKQVLPQCEISAL
jgi:serine/threonine protein kinase